MVLQSSTSLWVLLSIIRIQNEKDMIVPLKEIPCTIIFLRKAITNMWGAVIGLMAMSYCSRAGVHTGEACKDLKAC